MGLTSPRAKRPTPARTRETRPTPGREGESVSKAKTRKKPGLVIFVHGFISAPDCWDKLRDLLKDDDSVTSSFARTDPRGVWEWEYDNVREGVVDLKWDVADAPTP